MKRILSLVCLVCLMVSIFSSPALATDSSRVVLYTSSDENEIQLIRERLTEALPQYNVVIEYLSSGNHAAKLKAEGALTECDISYDLEYGYMEMLDREGIYADLSAYDASIFLEDLVQSPNYLPTMRYGSAVIVNTKVLADRGLPEPASYQDLLRPEYRNLISMPNPKSSGTGYMFYKSLVNAWGEAEALDYFDALAENILQFTSSGSAPVNSLVQEEVAIALGMTAHASLKITDGYPLKILLPEGSLRACGAAIIKGKETRQAVRMCSGSSTKPSRSETAPSTRSRSTGANLHHPQLSRQYPYADMSSNDATEKGPCAMDVLTLPGSRIKLEGKTCAMLRSKVVLTKSTSPSGREFCPFWGPQAAENNAAADSGGLLEPTGGAVVKDGVDITAPGPRAK